MLIDSLQTILKKHNLWAKKQFGQNFLIDESVHETIIGAADLLPDDVILEVGPGTGFLTERLIDRVERVIAVEKDADMVKVLGDRFDGTSNLTILQSDILKITNYAVPTGRQELKITNYKVVANIPYYITSPILKHFLQSDHRPSLMVLLVQKEVAEKIVGKTGKSLITIETQLFGHPEIVDVVPADAFYPAPKVQSAILKIDVYNEPLVPSDELKDFLRIVKFGFSQKRKKLANTLAAGLHQPVDQIRALLEKADLDVNTRAETLTIDDWKRLTALL